MPCPVCRDGKTIFFLETDKKSYHRCLMCQARLLHPRHFLRRNEEYAHYLTHENDPADPGYRAFLSKLADPLLERLPPNSSGLDYGCGPGPALAAMIREAGHKVALYDPFFAANTDVLSKSYDFVTCTETVEHFHHPARELDLFDRLLVSGGWLAIMTSFQTDDARFANWHYRKDPTHVVFYRETTFRVIAHARGWDCEVPAKDVVLMRKR